MKFDRQFSDHFFFMLYTGWLFGMEWIWENSSGKNIMIMYFGTNVALKVVHFIYYLSCPSDTENCWGQIIKWWGVIGSLLKFVDIRQVMLGNVPNNGTYRQYAQLELQLFCHFFNLAYIIVTILYFYFKKRRQQEKTMPHVFIGTNSTSYV